MPQRPLSNSEKYVASQTMAVARINLKNIDYFKFKKLVIDGNRDDYGSCSKEVQALCDCVQTLKFRDEEFDDESDRMRFAEICIYYKQILNSKRIESLDMRIKSGWWGDHKNAYSAGKIKPAALKELLITKAKAWVARHPPSGQLTVASVAEKIEGPGLYVFKHKEHQCFQFVGRADKIFSRVGEKLKASFEGGLTEPLAALLVISMSTDWDFYFMPVSRDDDERVLRVMENDLILKHDCIWPHGLNFRLHIDSLIEVSEFRKSCLRHRWPPEAEVEDNEISLAKLRKQIEMQEEGINPELPPEIVETPKKIKRRSQEERPPWEGIIDAPPSPTANGKTREQRGEAFVIPAFDPEPFERPDSPKSDISTATFVVAPQRAAPPSEITTSPAPTPTHTPTPGQRSPTKPVSRPTSRPTTPAKKAPRSAGIKPLHGQIPKKKQVSTPRSDGIDRVSSTTSLISNTENGTPRAKPKVREKDTNTPATPKRSPDKEEIEKSPQSEKGDYDLDSLNNVSPSQSSSSDAMTRSGDSIERAPSVTSLNSMSESKENEKQNKKKATTNVRKSHSFSSRSPRTSRPTSARNVGKTKAAEVTKSHSKLPVASTGGGGGGRSSPSHR